MSSKIKGGGRAILSSESQQSLIDLLYSLEEQPQDGVTDDNNDNSDDRRRQHEKKEQLQKKKFVKRLVRRHELRQLRQQYHATAASNVVDDASNDTTSITKVRKEMSSISLSTPTAAATITSSPNVRIELAEAIFITNDDKQKKKSNKKESKKKDDKKKNKKKDDDGNVALFKIGAKKVAVLSRSTTIKDLLKQSKSKLKLKKSPIRAFVQPNNNDSSLLFDLEHDLSGVVDGTVVYVTVTAKSIHDDVDHDDKDEGGHSNDEGEYDDDMDKVLNSIKLAYKKQQSYRNSQYQSRLQRVNEIVDETRRQSQLVGRQRLPVASYKQQIIDVIQQNQVVVLSGATGSGKSTQIPQFLLEESIEHCDVESSPQQPHYRPYIIVTQPRRVAAISLATRVAQERGCPQPGTLGSSVGYMVRSDRRADLRSCRIIYMTIGVLLRILLNNSSESSRRGEKEEEEGENDDNVPPLTLESISHLVIDETHERDVNTDFVLTLLKSMMISAAKKKSTLQLPRLILMSATASTELFVNYFTLPPIVTAARIDIPGKIFPVETYWLSECEKMTGKTMTTRLSNHDDGMANELRSDGVSSPRATEKIDDVFIRSLIVKIVEQQQTDGLMLEDVDDDTTSNSKFRSSGAILVFLPGLGEIESLARCLYDKATIVGNRDICNILKLHSTIPKSEQGRVFEPAAKGTVKIILSTNIAETSLTIPDVSYVIDSCRVKESRYQSSSRIKELVTVWTSHAAMKQRAGRAGRTSKGTCYRLCSEEFANSKLLPQTAPEMIWTPLDELILQICLLYEQRRDEAIEAGAEEKRNTGVNPLKFLSMTPTPPKEQSLVQSCMHLLEVGALSVAEGGVQSDRKYRLTPLGYHCSKLPMDAKIAKLLIIGCILGVLDNALIIAASLSCTKSCFISGRQLDPTAIEARDSLIENGFGGRDWVGGTVKSDLLAVIAVYRAWKNVQRNYKKEKLFCRSNALNHVALREIDQLRNQFLELVIDAGLASSKDDGLSDCNIAKEDALITSCCLVCGLYPNICTLSRPRRGGPKGGRLLTKDGDICKPSSSSFQRKRVATAAEHGKDAYAVYHTKHRTIGVVGLAGPRQRPRETFLSEVNFVSKFSLLLFGGQLELVKNAIIIDGWFKFKVSDDGENNKGSVIDNAVLILSLREALDKVILEHVIGTSLVSPEEKSAMIERHKRIIGVVRQILSEEG
ncbi:hypothetical protein ACHAWC_007988 [Mediolabrus comicus]